MEKSGVHLIKGSLNVLLKLILLFSENLYITSFVKLLGRITPDQWASYLFTISVLPCFSDSSDPYFCLSDCIHHYPYLFLIFRFLNCFTCPLPILLSTTLLLPDLILLFSLHQTIGTQVPRGATQQKYFNFIKCFPKELKKKRQHFTYLFQLVVMFCLFRNIYLYRSLTVFQIVIQYSESDHVFFSLCFAA